MISPYQFLGDEEEHIIKWMVSNKGQFLLEQFNSRNHLHNLIPSQTTLTQEERKEVDACIKIFEQIIQEESDSDHLDDELELPRFDLGLFFCIHNFVFLSLQYGQFGQFSYPVTEKFH